MGPFIIRLVLYTPKQEASHAVFTPVGLDYTAGLFRGGAAGAVHLGALWLRDHFGLGGWIMLAGVLLGVGGAVSGLCSSLKTMQRQAGEDEEKDPPVSFNDHR